MSDALRNQFLALGFETGLGNDDFFTEQATAAQGTLADVDSEEGASAPSRLGRAANGLDLEYESMDADAIETGLNVPSEAAASQNMTTTLPVQGSNDLGSSSAAAAGAAIAWPAEGPSNAALPLENGSNDTTAAVAASGDQQIDGLLSGVRWADGFITYSDPDSAADYQAGHPEAFSNFAQLSAQQMIAVHFGLNAAIYTQPLGSAGFGVEGFTNLGIDYAGSGTGAGTIRVANTSNPGTAYAYYPANDVYGGDAFFGPSGDFPTAGNYDWHTVLHELGHALGLKHGHESGVYGALPSNVDSQEYSIMTYRTFIGDDTSGYNYETWGAPQTFMMLDIAALQYMYGADYGTNSGDTVYSWSPTTGETYVNGTIAIDPGGNRIFATIWDGGGIDTYDLSNYTTNLTLDLAPGGHSVFSSTQLAYLGGGPNGGYARGNIFNALLFQSNTASIIENAIGGTGNDTISGNQVNNLLRGGDGNDRIDGGSGTDSLYGEGGDDTLIQNFGGPNEIMDGGAGNDTGDWSYSTGNSWIINLAAGTAIIGATVYANLTSIENVVGGQLADTITGDGGNNVLDGQDGNDTLNGGAGADAMSGGVGDDAYIVAALGDATIENAGEGTDTVFSYINWTLGANIERLDLEGGATNATGNGLNNTLVGNSLNNLLNGAGGNDYMRGGLGNDIYVVAAAGDVTDEDPGQGTDTVRSYINWTLGADVERLELQGAGNLNGTGNTLANTLVGNSGNNILSGGDGNDYISAGAGNDTLNGGAGNDTLIGAAGRDSLNGGTGNDVFDFDLVSHSPAGAANRDSIIGGFSHGFDRINLATIDANTLAGGNQAFAFIGSAAFSGVAGQLRYTNYSGTVIIDADVNGDSAADMQILVAGTNFMTGTDFIV